MKTVPDGLRYVPPARPARWRKRLTVKTVALGLIAAGVLLCLVPFGMLGYGIWQENQLTQSWKQSDIPQSAATATPDSTPAAATAVAPTPTPVRSTALDAALFAMQVPKLNYFAAVRQGVSLGILASGPGHYPGTVMPGQPGLVGIAAHNTYWIPFGGLGPGDTVILQTHGSTFNYRITGRKIVNPDDRTVLIPTSTPTLVLTTCWPLWAGDLASQRLVFFAQEV